MTVKRPGIERLGSPLSKRAWTSAGRANPVSAFGAAALMLLSIAGCASSQESVSAPLRLMQERFSERWDEANYMIATVETPQGLWNVYVVSIPPNQVAIRQSRQDGEYEFGMIDDVIWHIAHGRTAPSRLPEDWAWFLRVHEMYRFSEWLDTLHDLGPDGHASMADSGCSQLVAEDRFGLAVRLCVRPDGLPEWIERSTPAAYGEGTVRFDIEEWTEHDGKPMFRAFRQSQGSKTYDWVIEGVLVIPPEQAMLETPEGLAPRD